MCDNEKLGVKKYIKSLERINILFKLKTKHFTGIKSQYGYLQKIDLHQHKYQESIKMLSNHSKTIHKLIGCHCEHNVILVLSLLYHRITILNFFLSFFKLSLRHIAIVVKLIEISITQYRIVHS